MRRHPILLLLLIPLFAGCQSLGWKDDALPRATERLQGQLVINNGQLAFHSCQGERRLRLVDSIDSGLLDDALALSSDTGMPLFADVRGVLQRQDNEERMELTRVYRVQAEGHGCDTQGFPQLLLAAHGNEPGWSLRVTREGMLLERMDHSPLALPYLEEQLPGGQTHFSSEANGQQIGLWVAPQRCVDDSSGAVSHLTAELRLGDDVFRGCAYYGGARND
ncbi:MAG: COG3650 family protein [Pseudomonas sp.]